MGRSGSLRSIPAAPRLAPLPHEPFEKHPDHFKQEGGKQGTRARVFLASWFHPKCSTPKLQAVFQPSACVALGTPAAFNHSAQGCPTQEGYPGFQGETINPARVESSAITATRDLWRGIDSTLAGLFRLAG
jgi:hypothetical protein